MEKSSRPQREILALGESALLVEGISNLRALALTRRLEADRPPGCEAIVPGAASVVVRFDPLTTSRAELNKTLARLLADASPDDPTPSAPAIIRAKFGGDDGPDLPDVAARLRLSPENVVELLCAQPLRVMMIGFAPGYPYIGPLPDRLNVARRETPRAAVPAGSVAIAAGMAGIYPTVLPGGWHLIGRTDARLFDPNRDRPSLLLAGDWVQFAPA